VRAWRAKDAQLVRELGVAMYAGEDAVEAFDPDRIIDREAEKMREQNELAFARLREVLRWFRSIHEGENCNEPNKPNR
jgi:hypothetical protein